MWYFIVSVIVLVLAATVFCLWWFWLRLLPVSWKKCTLASLWDGPNAERRMMNMLSPHFSDGKFRDYLKWQKSRGCNTVHLFLANWRDGEGGGYSIYGTDEIDWSGDKGLVKRMLERIKECRKAGMAVVLVCMSDDSTAWNRKLFSDPERYVRDLKNYGFFKYASIVWTGLEMSDYVQTDAQVAALVAALRKYWNGKIATHDISLSLRFAHHGDIVFAQVDPKTSDAAMLAFAEKVKAVGKPCGIIEHRRNPDRERCKKLISAGLPFVGNW